MFDRILVFKMSGVLSKADKYLLKNIVGEVNLKPKIPFDFVGMLENEGSYLRKSKNLCLGPFQCHICQRYFFSPCEHECVRRFFQMPEIVPFYDPIFGPNSNDPAYKLRSFPNRGGSTRPLLENTPPSNKSFYSSVHEDSIGQGSSNK